MEVAYDQVLVGFDVVSIVMFHMVIHAMRIIYVILVLRYPDFEL